MIILRSLVILLMTSEMMPVPAQPPAETATRAAIVGYASNIEAFLYYRVRFKTTRGVATSEANAKLAKGTKEEPGEALFVRDGDRATLELFGATHPPKLGAADVKAAKGGVLFSEQKGFVNEKYLRDGKSHGSYVSFLESLDVQREEAPGSPTPFRAGVNSPLYTWYNDLGVLGPDRLLAQPAKFTPTFLGERVKVGRSLVGISFDNGASVRESWFDPASGYLPVEYLVTRGGKPSYTGEVTEVKEFRPGRFFPMRLVSRSEESTPGRWKFTETVVTELEVENRPSEKDLSIVFPAGTAVWSPGKHSGYFKLKQDELLAPKDLDELFDKLDKSSTDQRMDTAIEHTADRPGWWVWAAAIGGAVLIFLGGWLWWRKRRIARRASL